MDCSQLDLKGCLVGETGEAERRQVEAHLKACAACREEWERLRLVHSALMSVPEEEPPRRIAFVSDGVFEPRWWQRIWRSGPQLGFVSASLLAAAIVVHAFVRPAPVVRQAAADPAAIEARVQAEAGKRVEAIVAQAVAESDARQSQKTAELLKAAEQRMEVERRGDLVAVRDELRETSKKLTLLYKDIYMRASVDSGGPR